MTEETHTNDFIQTVAKQHFKKQLEIKQVIVRGIPVSRTSSASLFTVSGNQLFLFIQAEASMILDDVRKIAHRMGLEAAEFLPPAGNREFFDSVGAEKFRSVFPGRNAGSAADIRFYKLLAPYNPALVQIGAVKTGEIKQFDLDSRQWRHAARYSYRKVTPKDTGR